MKKNIKKLAAGVLSAGIMAVSVAGGVVFADTSNEAVTTTPSLRAGNAQCEYFQSGECKGMGAGAQNGMGQGNRTGPKDGTGNRNGSKDANGNRTGPKDGTGIRSQNGTCVLPN